MNNIQEEILKTVDKIVRERLNSLSFDYHIDGVVVEKINENKYKVRLMNGQISEMPSRLEESYNIGDIVCVLIQNNDYNHKIIDYKRPQW